MVCISEMFVYHRIVFALQVEEDDFQTALKAAFARDDAKETCLSFIVV